MKNQNGISLDVYAGNYNNEDAEKDILGVVLTNPQSFYDLQELIGDAGDELFFWEHSRQLWRALVGMVDAGIPITAITCVEYMIDTGQLSKQNANKYMRYLTDVGNSATSTAMFQHHIKILTKHYKRRRVVEIAIKLIGDAGADEIDDVILSAEENLMMLSDVGNHSESHTIQESIKEHFIEYESPQQTISTGFPDVDFYTGGLRGDQLTTLAARPGMGKTACALQITSHIALDQGLGVAFISLEMQRTKLAMRMICQAALVDSKNVQGRALNEGEWARYISAAGKLASSNVHIVDSYSTSLESIISQARRLVRREGVRVVFIDHLGLVESSKKFNDRQSEVSHITRQLKRLTKELNVPIVMLAQLNRNCENRANKRPGGADLRESGSIEQDSSITWFLYNDERYNPDTDDKGITEHIIDKSRDGSTGTARTKWFPQHTRFESLSPRDDYR